MEYEEAKMARETKLQLFKKYLTLIGSRMSAHRLHQFQMVINYMRLGHWLPSNGFQVSKRVRDRGDVFEAVAKQVYNKKVLYLEFGVNTGVSIRYWSMAIKHPDAKLHGFDSFEGLPEDFDVNGPITRNTHDNKGQIPHIDDPRVKFFKGWFEDVLPTYQLPEHDVLVMVLDADLYSSTLCVLNHLRSYIKPGTFIYFDELSRIDHEPRAFAEFMEESGLEFRLFSIENSLNRAFFECVK